MAQGAYCSGCARRVQLTESGECPQGHLRSMLRDVREGVETPSPRDVANGAARSAVPGPPVPPASHELLSAVIGKAFVIVPVAAILAFGLWTGYEQGVDTGMSVGASVMMSIGSLAVTVGLAFVWAKMNGRKKR